jgi:hypothetical protein
MSLDACRPAIATEEGPGATVPTFRDWTHQRIALDALTPNRNAAARQDAPAATAATTLSRRSTDSALDMSAGLLADRQLESDQPRVTESPSDSISAKTALAATGFDPAG